MADYHGVKIVKILSGFADNMGIMKKDKAHRNTKAKRTCSTKEKSKATVDQQLLKDLAMDIVRFNRSRFA